MKKRTLIVLLLFMFIIAPNYFQLTAQDSLLSQARQDSLTIKGASEKSMVGYYIKAFLATLAIILFVVFGARWYRKVSGQPVWSGEPAIHILNRKNIGAKQFILIVALDDKKYALGVTEQNISMLAELGPLSAEERQKQQKPLPTANFAQILNRLKSAKS